jgi:hypothetical protein
VLDFFKKIIDYFNTYHIPYMLSGSIAMSIYIIPRATKDIDFVIHLQPQDIDGLVNYFQGAYYCSKDAVTDAVNRQSIFNIIDNASGFKADFVILKNDEYRLTEFERRQEMDYYGTNIYVVSPEDLLISKLIWIQGWQAAVQMEDIKNLSLLTDLQNDYIDYWITKLNLNTFNLLQ